MNTRQAFGVVADHCVALRLPLHAGQPRRRGLAHALQRVGDGEHPAGRRTVRLPSRQTPQRIGRNIVAYRQASCTHRIPSHSRSRSN